MKKTPEFDDIPIIYIVAVLAHFGLCLESDHNGGYRAVKA